TQGDAGQAKLKDLSDSVNKTRAKLRAAYASWETLWSKSILTSEILEQQKKIFGDALSTYEKNYHVYENTKARWLIDLKASNQLTPERIVALTPTIKAMRHQ